MPTLIKAICIGVGPVLGAMISSSKKQTPAKQQRALLDGLVV
jgi:hypothetical protein